jgi:thymidylate kinase
MSIVGQLKALNVQQANGGSVGKSFYDRNPLKVLLDGPDGCGKGSIISKTKEKLENLGISVSVINTTAERNAPPSVRKVLISKESTPVERFAAALLLYAGGASRWRPGDSDVILFDRGWAGFLVYNQIPWTSFHSQALLIPDVDMPVLVTAPFEQLTARINSRNGSNFVSHQDSDLEYRHEVYSKYEECFTTLSELRGKDFKIIHNDDGCLDKSVYELTTHILARLNINAQPILSC